MNFRTMFLRFGVVALALGLGVAVMIVAQDTQRLQRQQKNEQAQMARNAERLRVLEAEWAYLTRPSYLQAQLQRVEPGAEWIPIRGENMARLDDFLGKAEPQVADAGVAAPPAQ